MKIKDQSFWLGEQMMSRGKYMIINRRCKYFISHEPNDEDKNTDFFTLFILFINCKTNLSHMGELICIWYLHKAMHADQVPHQISL